MTTTLKLNWKILFIIFLSLFYIGCGSNQVLISPKYDNKELKPKINRKVNAKAVKVVDNRIVEAKSVGIAQTGVFNKKTPYVLDVPVSEFVGKSVTQMLSVKNDSLFLPLKIVINNFTVWETEDMLSESGHFSCELNFVYPVSDAEFDTIKTKAVEKSGSIIDVTDGLEELMYKGISDCTDEFLKNYQEKSSTFLTGESDTAFFKNTAELIPVPADTVSTNVPDSAAPKYDYRKAVAELGSNQYIGVSYLQGKNVRYGFQVLYQNFDKLGSHTSGGFGYLFLFYDVENQSQNLKGSFVNLGYKYELRYFPSTKQKGLYFSGGLRLAFGNEKIDYGYKEETHFFFGPTAEEAIGVSINDRVLMEAGAYQVKLWGSDLLPDDTGFSFSFYFRI